MIQEEMPFKDISDLELWWPFAQQNKTICAVFDKGIMRNIYVKLL